MQFWIGLSLDNWTNYSLSDWEILPLNPVSDLGNEVITINLLNRTLVNVKPTETYLKCKTCKPNTITYIRSPHYIINKGYVPIKAVCDSPRFFKETTRVTTNLD